ncbi:MAG: hypothetical protein ABR609_15305 [Acidimicrobiia bacterium]
MSKLKMRTARVLRTIARTNASAGKVIEHLYNRPKVVTGSSFDHTSGRNYTIVRSASAPEAKRVGIYLRGGCDVPAVFGVAKMMRASVTGTLAIWRDPVHITGTRSDLLLQALDGIDPSATSAIEEVSKRLQLRRGYFNPRFFDPTFTVRRQEALGPFPKSVVVLSVGSDYTRRLYRHREHGFLVDPGGFWLGNNIESAIADPDSVKWFAKTFKSVGRLSVEQFHASFGRLVSEVKARANAHVAVFNVLTVNPLERTHNYGLIDEHDTSRRRDFIIALAELSRELDFDVIDVDRALKLHGLNGQVDFAHITEAQFAPITAECYRVFRQRELI